MNETAYDELPYPTAPIEWTAPERLALASSLHGGPRTVLDDYRVLELGCADGANLLPMAWFRRHASFVGVDGAGTRIAVARDRAAALELANVRFVHADFADADAELDGTFDFVIAHGVFSWISAQTREALLRLVARRLRPGGLFYVNYNALPGWSVRGTLREFLCDQTAMLASLPARAQAAKALCRALAGTIDHDAPPWRRLLADELRFVGEGHPSYVAHEYLAPDNYAFWRRDFLALVAGHGLEFVADADFDQPWQRDDEGLEHLLEARRIAGSSDDTLDLLCYRQLHSAILTPSPLVRRELDVDEWSRLRVASCLAPRAAQEALPALFEHPSGYEVEVREEPVARALRRLLPLWPRSLPVGEVFDDPAAVTDDLRLLHRNGLVHLRCVEPPEAVASSEPLHRLEAPGGYCTTAYHTREPADAPTESDR